MAEQLGVSSALGETVCLPLQFSLLSTFFVVLFKSMGSNLGKRVAGNSRFGSFRKRLVRGKSFANLPLAMKAIATCTARFSNAGGF
jgi:hypothetical protein